MRSKYGIYPEYHTSLDTLGGVVTSKGLEGGYLVVRAALEALERNGRPRAMVLGEPQLGKRGLYPSLSTRDSGTQVAIRMELLTWADGKHTLMEIADKCGVPVWELYGEVETLTRAGLLEELWGF